MIIRTLVLLAALCISGIAHAAETAWSAVGNNCVSIDLIGNSFNLPNATRSSIKHATDNVDPIHLSCAVPRFSISGNVWNLALTYQSVAGHSTATFVQTDLYRMRLGGATPELLATARSNTSAITTLNTVQSPTFNHTFDFDGYTYWVLVVLDRVRPDQTVIFHSVYLRPKPAG
jgi:hypothetical protein